MIALEEPSAERPPVQGLDALAAEVRRDFARLNHPPANWVLPATAPDGRAALDVLVIGAGMCGQSAAFGLLREGVSNIRVVDRAPRGLEGPWGTFARMETLRSPKHLTGPDLGIPSLTFRAWYEAQHGETGWRDLYKVARLDWLRYLGWVRDTAAIPVENDTEILSLAPADDLVRAETARDRPATRRSSPGRWCSPAAGRAPAGVAIPPSGMRRAGPRLPLGRGRSISRASRTAGWRSWAPAPRPSTTRPWRSNPACGR